MATMTMLYENGTESPMFHLPHFSLKAFNVDFQQSNGFIRLMVYFWLEAFSTRMMDVDAGI